MPNHLYGIKLVWAGWKDDPEVGFSDLGFERWKDEVGVGTRMLIYETMKPRPGDKIKGTQSIVAEVEITRGFELAPDRAPTEQHEHLVAIKILRPRGSVQPIPRTAVRKLIRVDTFPHQGENFHPLDETTYKRLLLYWK